MEAQKTYLPDEFEQKIPKKILWEYHLQNIGSKEKILAVLGKLSLFGAGSSIVAVEDRLVYENNEFVKTAGVKKTVSFLDFDRFETETKNNYLQLYIVLNNGEKLDTGILTTEDQLNKFITVVNSQKENGMELAKQYKSQNIDTTRMAILEIPQKVREETDRKIEENNKKIETLEARRDLIIKNKIKEIAPLFKEMMEEMSKIEILKLRLQYCGGFENLKPGQKHEIYINHLKQAVAIYPPFKQKIVIPFANIKGAHIEREDGIPQNKLTDEQKLDEVNKKIAYHIVLKYSLKGDNFSIVYFSKQNNHQVENSVFVMEYILNNLPRLADYFAERRSQEEKLALEQELKNTSFYQKEFENHDLNPQTEYQLQYCIGLDEIASQTNANITLDKNFLKIELNNPAKSILIPLENVKNSESNEEYLVDYPEKKDDSIFHIKISYILDGKDYTLSFLRRQKHLPMYDQVGELNYLLHKRIRYFHPQTPASAEQSQPVENEKSDYTKELRELKSLLDDGIITQEEFDAKKKQLLNL